MQGLESDRTSVGRYVCWSLVFGLIVLGLGAGVISLADGIRPYDRTWVPSPPVLCAAAETDHDFSEYSCYSDLPRRVNCPVEAGGIGSYMSNYHVALVDSNRVPHHFWYSSREAFAECLRFPPPSPSNPCPSGQSLGDDGECGCGDSAVYRVEPGLGGECLACPTGSAPNDTGDDCYCVIPGEVAMGTWWSATDPPRCEVPCVDPPYSSPPLAFVPEIEFVDHVGEWRLYWPTRRFRLTTGMFSISSPNVSSLKCTRLCSGTYRLDGDIETSYNIMVARKIPPKPGMECADGDRSSENMQYDAEHERNHAIAYLAVINTYKFQLRELATESLTEDQCTGKLETLPAAFRARYNRVVAREGAHRDMAAVREAQISCVNGKVVEE